MKKKKRDMAEIEQARDRLQAKLAERPVTMPKTTYNAIRAVVAVLDWCTDNGQHPLLDEPEPKEPEPAA